MQNSMDPRQVNGHSANGSLLGSELHMFAKIVGVFALLTGVLYLRAAVADSTWLQTDGTISAQAVLVIALVIVGILSLLATFRWEAVGSGLAVLSGLALFGLLLLLGNGIFSAFFYGSPFVVAGLLFLGCWWRAHQGGSRE